MQLVQGNLGRAIEPDIYNAGAGPGRGITLQTVILPGPGTVAAGTTHVAHQGKTTRQANLPRVRVPA